MSRKYTPEFKAKIVFEVLQGDRELSEIAADNNLNPNMLRAWKAEFVKNANRGFNQSQSEKKMLRTIGPLTMKRDFPQDVFRRNGYPVPIQDKL